MEQLRQKFAKRSPAVAANTALSDGDISAELEELHEEHRYSDLVRYTCRVSFQKEI
jgi:hypothetical protein